MSADGAFRPASPRTPRAGRSESARHCASASTRRVRAAPRRHDAQPDAGFPLALARVTARPITAPALVTHPPHPHPPPRPRARARVVVVRPFLKNKKQASSPSIRESREQRQGERYRVPVPVHRLRDRVRRSRVHRPERSRRVLRLQLRHRRRVCSETERRREEPLGVVGQDLVAGASASAGTFILFWTLFYNICHLF